MDGAVVRTITVGLAMVVVQILERADEVQVDIRLAARSDRNKVYIVIVQDVGYVNRTTRFHYRNNTDL